jgi:basic membrane protein A and related proteins
MVGRYTRRQFIWYGSAAFGSSLLLKACTNQPNSTPTSSSETKGGTDAKKDFKVAMVLPGIITDKAWNQVGYTGLDVIKNKQNAQTDYVEKVAQPDQVETLSDFARRGYNLIFAHGGQFDASIQQVAAEFPKTFFVGVNGAVKGDNIASLRIDSLQGGYVSGVVAAAMTKSNKIAYLCAQKFQSTDDEKRGFELGAKSVKPNIQVTASYTGDWNDAAKAKEASLALISAGNDVIYHWLDNAAPAVLETASEKGVYAIGNTADQQAVAPKAVLTSIVKRIDLAIAYMADLATSNQLKGQIYTIGWEKPDILYLGKFGAMVPEAAQKKAQEAVQGIVDRKIKLT